MRRGLIILAGVIFLLMIGLGVYFFFTNRAHIVVAPQQTQRTSFPVIEAKPSTQKNSSRQNTVLIGSQQSSNIQTVSTSVNIRKRLAKITAGPVVPGVVVFNTTTSTSTIGAVIHYITRKNGNVFGYNVNKSTLSRLSNKTIPGIEQATWLSNGSLAYVRYSEPATRNVSTYALPSNGIGGFFLPQNLTGVAVFGSSAVVTLSSNENGSLVTHAQPDSSNTYTVFNTPLSSIVTSFAGRNNYLVYTKPSAAINGYAFLVSNKTGEWNRIAGPLHGLVAKASPDGSIVLVSYITAGGAMQLELVDAATHIVTQLPVPTIADKCVWGVDNKSIYCGIPTNPPRVSYPDDWYQGAVAFNDEIWKINVASRYAQLVLKLSKENVGIFDVETLAVDPKNTVLSFINKNDGSLWVYRLKQ